MCQAANPRLVCRIMSTPPDQGAATAPTAPTYGRGICHLWHLRDDATFLNHGSFGLTPKSVLAAQDAFRREMESQPVQFLHRENLAPRLRAAAAQLAAFMGARGDDLAFVDNATTGVNAVLRAFPLQAGDEVLLNDHTYPAVRNAIHYVCQRSGARPVEVPLPFPATNPDAIVAAVRERLSPRTRLAVFDHVSSATALVMPVVELAAVCRPVGAKVLIDAAHAPGMLALDLPSMGADWISGNAHKWLFAPKGCAFLWAAKAAQADMHPTVISHGFGQGFLAEFDWTGTRDPTAWLALPAALDFYRQMGDGALRARNHALACEAGRRLAAAWKTTVGAPDAMVGSMAVVRLPGNRPGTLEAAAAVHDRLWRDHRIEVPVIPFAGTLWIRVSAQIYNEMADYERLAEVVAGW